MWLSYFSAKIIIIKKRLYIGEIFDGNLNIFRGNIHLKNHEIFFSNGTPDAFKPEKYQY